MKEDQFASASVGLEVNGESVLAIIDALPAFSRRARESLKECGIVDPQPGEWYSQKGLMDALKKIAEGGGGSLLFQVGKTILSKAQMPPDIHDFTTAFALLDTAYHMNHRRNGQVMFNSENQTMLEGIGHYSFRPPAGYEKRAQVVCDNPYPCEFDHGLITFAARQFKPQEALLVNVSHDDSQPCRNKGGRSCTYIINW
jgi:hypothetical protein